MTINVQNLLLKPAKDYNGYHFLVSISGVSGSINKCLKFIILQYQSHMSRTLPKNKFLDPKFGHNS